MAAAYTLSSISTLRWMRNTVYPITIHRVFAELDRKKMNAGRNQGAGREVRFPVVPSEHELPGHKHRYHSESLLNGLLLMPVALGE